MNLHQLKKCPSLVDVIRLRAQQHPNRLSCTFINRGIEENMIYASLEQHAKAIAAHLQASGVQPGDRVLLIFSPGLPFIQAFIACLYAGCVAVPIYPPLQDKIMDKALRIIANAKPALILTSTVGWALAQQLGSNDTKIPCLVIDNIDLADGNHWQDPQLQGHELAFLQYTSGSTSHPKGVMVGHHNLIDNLERIYKAYQFNDETLLFSWLPPQHDMGLIGGILTPIYGGIPVKLMSPFSFLQNPLSWLQNITKYRTTCSMSPNFAYDYCVKRIKEEKKQGLDLSSWTIASNGAEPIRQETLEQFYHAFKEYGFRKEAFYPCYGLAETTLIVSGGIPGTPYRSLRIAKEHYQNNKVHFASENTPQSHVLIGCGNPVLKVRIVNPETLSLCEPDQIGEIWVQGDSVAQGYWGQEEETQQGFHGMIQGDDSQQKYLRTGDLGFMHDSELYVTGRIKDLIILYGKNYYPQDIEHSLSQSPIQTRLGKCAAFVTQSGHEFHLTVMCEIKNQRMTLDEQEDLFNSINQLIYQAHQLEIHTIVLIPLKEMPHTTSGKVRRNFCRNYLLDNSLTVLATWQSNKRCEHE